MSTSTMNPWTKRRLQLLRYRRSADHECVGGSIEDLQRKEQNGNWFFAIYASKRWMSVNAVRRMLFMLQEGRSFEAYTGCKILSAVVT